MIRKFLSSQEKSFGSFFLVLIAVSTSNSIHRVRQEDFLTGLFSNALGSIILLSLVGIMMYFLLAPKDLSVEKLNNLIKSQNVKVSNYEIIKICLFSILAVSSFQYFTYRNETNLTFWHFLLSTAISISLGFLARSICSHFLNRRIQTEIGKTSTLSTSS